MSEVVVNEVPSGQEGTAEVQSVGNPEETPPKAEEEQKMAEQIMNVDEVTATPQDAVETINNEKEATETNGSEGLTPVKDEGQGAVTANADAGPKAAESEAVTSNEVAVNSESSVEAEGKKDLKEDEKAPEKASEDDQVVPESSVTEEEGLKEPAPVAEEQPAPVAEEQPAPVEAQQPAPVAEEQPAPEAAEELVPAAAEETAPVEAAEQPAPEAAEQPASEAAAEPVPVAAEETAPVEAAEQPAPEAEEQPAPVAEEQPAPEAAAEPAPEAAAEPVPVEAAEQPAPVAEEQPAPVAAEQPVPVAAEAAPVEAAEQPAPEAGEQPAPVAEEQPAPVAAEEPAPVAAEQPVPVAAEAAPVEAAEQPAPEAGEQPAPEAGEQPAPVAAEEPVPAEETAPVEAADQPDAPLLEVVPSQEVTTQPEQTPSETEQAIPAVTEVNTEEKKTKVPPKVMPKPKIEVPEIKVQLFVKAHARFPNKLGDCPFSHRVMMILKAKKIGGSVCPVNLNIKSAAFEDICSKNGLPLKVPILRHGETVIGDSNLIADYLDKLKPEPSLLCTDKKVIAAGDKVFLKFSAFVKNKIKSSEDKLRHGLVDELERLDAFLGSSPGVFLAGDDIKHPDCSLLPKLHHVRVASKHYKNFEMPESLVNLSAYFAAADKHPAFTATAPANDAIIEGWRKHMS